MADVDDDYFLPLQDQRVFGAGIKRRKIAFVPASAAEEPLPDPSRSLSAGSRYLSIVLPRDTNGKTGDSQDNISSREVAERCAVCNQAIQDVSDRVALDVHESSIAHQVCLQHSHPPSHLDRDHVGVRYLATYGWDPDSRTGLGARQEGIKIPIKVKEKKDTVGLRETKQDEKVATTRRDDKVVKVNAKELRRQQAEAKKRAEKLRQSFYGPDLEKYFGPNS